MKVTDLFEALFHLDDAVDYIFDEAFGKFFKGIEKYKRGDVNINEVLLRVREFSMQNIVKNIKNPKIQEAMTIFPIEIKAAILTGRSRYVPQKGIIELSLNPTVYSKVINAVTDGMSYEDMVELERLEGKERAFLYELSGEKIKTVIAHELSHWLDDVFHGRHLTTMSTKMRKFLERGKQKEAEKLALRRQPYVYMTDYEINAIIHGIKQMKRNFSREEWNAFTLEDLIDMDSSLKLSHDRIMKRFGRNEVANWKKFILKRLHRERLLGRNMRFRR